MMGEEGFEIDDITLELVEDRMAKQQDKPQQTSESKTIFAGGLVCADIECIFDSTNTFIPIVVFYSRGYSKTMFHHWGTNCVDLFIQTLLQWVKEEKAKESGVQEFHLFFHNLKRFDRVFIMNSLYKLNLKVTDIMGTRTKMLHFKHKSLSLELPIRNVRILQKSR